MKLIPYLIDRYTGDEEKRLALKISTASFVIFVSILSAIIGSSYLYEYRALNRELMDEKNIVENNPAIRNIIRSENTSRGIMRNDERRRGPRDILVFDNEKNITKNDFLNLNEAIIAELFSLQEGQYQDIEIDDHTYLITRKDIDSSTIFLFRDLSPMRSFHMTLIIIALFGSLVGLTVIYLLSRFLARITIEPIREQARELEAYSHNVAHELRTPLSIMRSNLELLRIKPESRFIDSSDEEIVGMEHIIESLLFLAKPHQKDQKTDIDITEKTREIIEKYPGEYNIVYTHEKKHTIKKLNEELYKRVVCNLIENAIKYKSEGSIDINLSRDSIRIINTISEEITPEEQDNLTKTFYQGDQSRNSSGYGLGLALVAKIVEISDWRMKIDTSGKKFSVEIWF